MNNSEIEKLKKQKKPYDLGGLHYCYSTFKQEYVCCSEKELPILGVGGKINNGSFIRNSTIEITPSKVTKKRKSF